MEKTIRRIGCLCDEGHRVRTEVGHFIDGKILVSCALMNGRSLRMEFIAGDGLLVIYDEMLRLPLTADPSALPPRIRQRVLSPRKWQRAEAWAMRPRPVT